MHSPYSGLYPFYFSLWPTEPTGRSIDVGSTLGDEAPPTCVWAGPKSHLTSAHIRPAGAAGAHLAGPLAPLATSPVENRLHEAHKIVARLPLRRSCIHVVLFLSNLSVTPKSLFSLSVDS